MTTGGEEKSGHLLDKGHTGGGGKECTQPEVYEQTLSCFLP